MDRSEPAIRQGTAGSSVSMVVPLISISGIVPPLLMIHLLFSRSSWAISTWMYCSARVPFPSSSCRIARMRLDLGL